MLRQIIQLKPGLEISFILQCVYWKWGHSDNNNQSDGRSETIGGLHVTQESF